MNISQLASRLQFRASEMEASGKTQIADELRLAASLMVQFEDKMEEALALVRRALEVSNGI